MSEYEKVNWDILMRVFTKLRELYDLLDKVSKVTYIVDELNTSIFELLSSFTGDDQLVQMLEDYNEGY